MKYNLKNLTLTSVSAIILSAAISASPAYAADTETLATPNASQIEIITVTARKKTELSRDVPASLTAVRGEQLTQITSGGADISSISARVPSLIVESSFGRTFPRFYIRGLGNTDFDLNASQPVSLVYDDVVFENPILKGFPVFDVERIEVLRGPQGTTFGRNTPAGVVKFESVKAGSGRSNYVKLGVRSFGGIDAEGAFDTKISETLDMRISALFQSQDDWIADLDPAGGNEGLGEYEEKAARIQFRYRPTEALDANLNIHGRDMNGTSQIFRANVMTTGKSGLNSNFVRDEVHYDSGLDNIQELTTYGLNLNIKFDFGGVNLTAITGYENVEFYGRGDIDGGSATQGPGFIPFGSDTADGIDGLDQWSQEIRFASDKTGPLSWQAGAFYFSEDLSIYSLAYFSDTGVFSDARQTQKTDAWALFGSVNYEINDKLDLTAGLRYSDEEKTLVARGGIANLSPIRAHVADDAVTWDVSAVYKLTPEVNLYGRVARGFRAPAIQGRLLFGTAVTTAKSETLTSGELGIKALVLDKRLRFDLSIYRYEIDNQQFTAIGGAGNTNTLINVDKGVGFGFEGEIQYLITNNLELSANFSYNYTEISDPNAIVATCGAPCTSLNRSAGAGLAYIDGNAFPNAPEAILNLGAKYSLPLANGNEFAFSTDWSYKAETNFFLYKSVEFAQDGFWEGGIRAAYLINDGKYEIAAYGRNITDTEALVGGIDFNNLTGFVNNPRIWGLEGKMKF